MHMPYAICSIASSTKQQWQTREDAFQCVNLVVDMASWHRGAFPFLSFVIYQQLPVNLTFDAVRLVRSTKTVACSNSRVYVHVPATRTPLPLGAPSWHLACG